MLQGVLQRQRVDHGGEHAHVVGGDTVHFPGRGRFGGNLLSWSVIPPRKQSLRDRRQKAIVCPTAGSAGGLSGTNATYSPPTLKRVKRATPMFSPSLAIFVLTS